jgi:hypothetical protein
MVADPEQAKASGEKASAEIKFARYVDGQISRQQQRKLKKSRTDGQVSRHQPGSFLNFV